MPTHRRTERQPRQAGTAVPQTGRGLSSAARRHMTRYPLALLPCCASACTAMRRALGAGCSFGSKAPPADREQLGCARQPRLRGIAIEPCGLWRCQSCAGARSTSTSCRGSEHVSVLPGITHSHLGFPPPQPVRWRYHRAADAFPALPRRFVAEVALALPPLSQADVRKRPPCRRCDRGRSAG